MKKRILSILLLCCMVLTLLPTAAFAAGEIDEQFTLAPGGTYYFDLSAMGIPGTVNDALPDKTMGYVPFTYAGTVDSYKLTSEMATTEEYAQQSKYAHSLFIADFAVTHEVSWDELNAGRLIFGRDYAAGGVDYILRAPSVGSGRIGSAESQRGTPPSNEWDRILDKNDGYIKNWFGMYSWGQDTLSTSASDRAARGYFPPGGWSSAPASHQDAVAGFRPVLEVLNPGSLGSDGLKAVTLDLGGGKLGDESSIQIIVETGSVFTAPASDGLTRPDGNTGNYFMWRDNDGQLYAPGDYVPADVTKLTAQFNLPEQFTLAPGGTYYFDLSAMGIPGTVNDALPDKTMGYVPFTYAGTVDSYKLTSEMATTEEDAEQNQYPHSLFVADYAVTHTISWDDLNTANLIFGKNYASGGVDYTLRAPSVGSNATGLGDSDPGEPQSNEWDTMLNKDSGYIQNWNEMYSWGQDTVSFDASFRAVRGYYSARYWHYINASRSYPDVGFRPVLEVLNPGTMGSDRLKAVTLDLGGGKLGGSSEAIQIVVKNGESFAAPASEGLTRPDGNTGSYFKWLGSDGKLYVPGGSVPANVNKLTAQFDYTEQFTLDPGGTYYFDLSGVGIPDTVNDALPDNTLHYVPFTYAGTVDAYKLMSEMATTEEYAQQNKYAHSLFVADYAVTYAASWDHLNAIDMIFGKDYAAGGVDYTLRAPSEGSDYTGSGDSERGTPQSNEWDRLLDKDDGYIKNWNGLFSCGQDSVSGLSWRRTVRGYYSSRFCGHRHAAGQNPQVGFRPVLEVLNHDTIGPDGLKAVALDLGGGKLGDESSIRIIVKNGSAFTAPSGDGLTRPEGATGNYFKWLGSDGKLYAPGESVSADVTTLTARFVPDTYTVIVTTDTLPDGKTGKAYSHTLTAISTAPITWRIDEGALPAGLRLNEKTGEISGIPTAEGTATFTVKAENSEGSDTRALSITVNNAVEQTPVRYLDADGKERFCTEYTVLESVIIEDFFNSDNKWYDMPAGWYVMLDGVFNHTGDDSRYFNRGGFFDTPGAYQSKESPWYDWFCFQHWPDKYDAWWGIDTLPAVNENAPAYRDFIIRAQDSVIRRWLRCGADGWRLDVADELPDDFIEEIRAAMEQEKPDSFLLGEVWEDGSNKIAYSRRRKYLLGRETHGLMNYPLRTAALDYLRGGDAADFRDAMEEQRENYPPAAFYSGLNILGTHDTPRILTLLGADTIPDSKEARAAYHLSPEARRLAVRRLTLAAMLLYTFPGSPTLYYGDEAGMEGFEDPMNRQGFPWGREDQRLLTLYRTLGRLRKERESLQSGDLTYLTAEGGLLIFCRKAGGERTYTALNTGDTPRDVTLPWPNGFAVDAVTLQRFWVRDDMLRLTLPPCDGVILV